MTFAQASVSALRKLPPVQQQATYGLRVLTTRFWLRLARKRDIDIWIPDAGPSRELLVAIRAGQLTDAEFLARYEEEQHQATHCRVVCYVAGDRVATRSLSCSPLAYLSQLGKRYGRVTVLCLEAEPLLCHRHRLLQLLQEEAQGSTEKTAGQVCPRHAQQRATTVMVGWKRVCLWCAIEDAQRQKMLNPPR
jgi:uncharacterized protein YeaO (DUF488 family)